MPPPDGAVDPAPAAWFLGPGERWERRHQPRSRRRLVDGQLVHGPHRRHRLSPAPRRRRARHAVTRRDLPDRLGGKPRPDGGPGDPTRRAPARGRVARRRATRSAVAVTSTPGALRGAGQRRPSPASSTRRAPRSSSTNGYDAPGATIRSSSSSTASERRGGSVAFVGGIDLCHGRNDDHDHRGDPQPVELDRRYGPRPPWHDAQARAARSRRRTTSSRPSVSGGTTRRRMDHRNPIRR